MLLNYLNSSLLYLCYSAAGYLCNPPFSSSTGLGTKKKGIIIRCGSELQQINRLLAYPKVIELAKKIEVVKPKAKEDSSWEDKVEISLQRLIIS